MRQLLTAYIGLTCATSVAAVAAGALLPLTRIEWSWWGAAALLLAAVVTERMAVPVPTGSTNELYVVSVATIPHIACALLLPPPVAAMVAAAGMLVDELRSGSRPERLLFNVCNTTLAVAATSLLANALDITGARLGDGAALEVVQFLVVAGSYYLTNALVLAGVGAIANRRSFWTVLRSSARFTAPAELVVTILGGLAAFIWVKNPFWVPIGLAPALIAQLALGYIAASNRKANQLVTLDRLGHDLSGTLVLSEVIATLTSHIRGLRAVEGLFVHVSDGSVLETDGIAVEPAVDAVWRRVFVQVSATGTSTHIADAGSHPNWDDGQEVAARSWVVLPLRAGDRPLGHLGIVARQAHAFSAEEVRFFTLIGERAAAALDNVRRAAELSRMAYHDPLTGLPNRALLLDRLSHALVATRRRGGSVALLFLDLDNFKLINDSLGHEAGDVMLVEVARRLQRCVREVDTVARLGGDEFTVLLEDISDEHEARQTADRIASGVRVPLSLNGHEVVVSTSMGIALSGPGREHAETLLRAADMAMYEAKADGKGQHSVFDPRMEQRAFERLEIESQLRRALERDEFRVHYQPIVRLLDGHVAELEALVRWQHPERGLVSPAVFIPVAEETGLVVQIGHWVLNEVCRQLRVWQDELPPELVPTVSINLSARQFQQPTLVTDIADVVREHDVDIRHLKLEITESAVMRDAQAARRALQELKITGLHLAIDDFGTGYSSLSYLKQFPVDTLKIDRSFVDGVGQDPQNTAIVRSIVALANTLNLSVTAEGIETSHQRSHLHAMGCQMGQGYLFARPLPANQVYALLTRGRDAYAEPAA